MTNNLDSTLGRPPMQGADSSRRILSSQRAKGPNSSIVWLGRVMVLALLILGWSVLPTSKSLRARWPVFDGFFLSSPSRVASELTRLLGRNSLEFWANFGFTVEGASLGLALGLVCSLTMALVLTSTRLMRAALMPIMDLINAIPTIALIPVIVLMFGPTLQTSVVIAALSVFFFTVFNAYAGGASMPPDLAENAAMLGASRAELMWRLRLRYVVAWTIQILPGAIGHALASAFAAELFSGSPGLGRLVMQAILSINSDLTFATVTVIAVLGVFLTVLGSVFSARYLRWFAESR
jgi:NitT/TauT family transport system permease protein